MQKEGCKNMTVKVKVLTTKKRDKLCNDAFKYYNQMGKARESIKNNSEIKTDNNEDVIDEMVNMYGFRGMEREIAKAYLKEVLPKESEEILKLIKIYENKIKSETDTKDKDKNEYETKDFFPNKLVFEHADEMTKREPISPPDTKLDYSHGFEETKNRGRGFDYFKQRRINDILFGNGTLWDDSHYCNDIKTLLTEKQFGEMLDVIKGKIRTMNKKYRFNHNDSLIYLFFSSTEDDIINSYHNLGIDFFEAHYYSTFSNVFPLPIRVIAWFIIQNIFFHDEQTLLYWPAVSVGRISMLQWLFLFLDKFIWYVKIRDGHYDDFTKVESNSISDFVYNMNQINNESTKEEHN